MSGEGRLSVSPISVMLLEELVTKLLLFQPIVIGMLLFPDWLAMPAVPPFNVIGPLAARMEAALSLMP